jgi:5-methylcytosine-specific restriction endonuclease McrA
VSRSKYSQWYASRRWRRIRAELLARNPLCEFCTKQGRVTPATIADHIEPHRGDLEKFWNSPLQALCATCHSSTKQAMENDRVMGFGADGWPLG